MKKKQLISIILTYYKKKKFIEKTLLSIDKQSYKNFEVILVYDDSDKNELYFIKKIIKRYKKIKLIINKENFGVAKSRNIGIKKSKGQLISFIDADDLWKPNKLKEQIKMMLKNDSDISYTAFNVINDTGNIINTRNVSKSINYSKLIKSCEIGLSTVVAKREVFTYSKFPNLKTQEDFALWLKLIKLNLNFLPINRVLSSWRKTNDSLSSNKIQKLFDAFKLFYKIENKNFIISIISVVILLINKIKKTKYE